MEKRIWQVLGFWAMGLLLFMATMIIIRWSIGFVTWSTMDSGWAQAIGSAAAIMASFFLFRRQREHELEQARDDGLRQRLLAMQAVSDVAFHAIEAIKQLAEPYECDFHPGIVPDLALRLPELRAILDRFAEPTADRIVVLVALIFSTALAETQDDIKVWDRELKDGVVTRLYNRISQLEKLQDRLLVQLRTLEAQCRARGIGIDYDEAVFAGE